GLVGLAILAMIPIGKEALPVVLWVLLLGWTTDLLDGRLARRLEVGPSWIGEHEFEFDMFMVFCSAIYLVVSGVVPRGLGTVYLAVAAPVALLSHSRAGYFLKFKALTMALAVPWVFGPFVVAYLRGEELVAYAGILWMAMALLVDWRRFTGVVEDFLAGARAFLRR
ncbi:MAG: hypothetical protein R6U88_01570, partial [Candidatus Bipolaricaulota bacterium]